MSTATEKIGVKLAGALLLQYGEIPTEYIRAMPFLAEPHEAEKVISNLLKLFDVEVYQRMISSYPMPEWEEVIRLKGSYLEKSLRVGQQKAGFYVVVFVKLLMISAQPDPALAGRFF